MSRMHVDLLGKTYTDDPDWSKQEFTFSLDPNEVLLALFFNHPGFLSSYHPNFLSHKGNFYHEIYENGLPCLLSTHDIEQKNIDIVFQHLSKDYQNKFITTFLLKNNRKYPSRQLLVDYLKDVISREDQNHLTHLLSEDYAIIDDIELLSQLIQFAIEITDPRNQSLCLKSFSKKAAKIYEKITSEIILSRIEMNQFLKYRNNLLSRNCIKNAPTVEHIGFQCYFMKLPNEIDILSTIQKILKTTENYYKLHAEKYDRFIARAVTSEFAFSQYHSDDNQPPIELSLQTWSMLVEGIEFIAKQIQGNVQALIGTFIVRLNDNKTVSYCMHIECGMTPCISVKAKLYPHHTDPNYKTSYQFKTNHAKAERSEIYSVEFVNNDNNQTVPFVPIFQTPNLTHVVDICNDLSENAAFTRLLRSAILNKTAIDQQLCYTLIATHLCDFRFNKFPSKTPVYASQEVLTKDGAIISNLMEVSGVAHKTDYKRDQVHVCAIQYSAANGFSYKDDADDAPATPLVNIFFFHRSLGITVPVLDENAFSRGVPKALGRLINQTLFAYGLDVPKHNFVALTSQAHRACVSSGFFRLRECGVLADDSSASPAKDRARNNSHN